MPAQNTSKKSLYSVFRNVIPVMRIAHANWNVFSWIHKVLINMYNITEIKLKNIMWYENHDCRDLRYIGN